MLERKLFSPEHDMFRDSVRRFIADEIKPHHEDWQKAGITPRSLWEKAGEAGLLCTTVPEAFGGYGADFLYSAIVIEELARANTPDIAFYTHSDIATPYLIDFGTEEQKRTLLPDMVAGRKICSLGMSEPDAGSDVASIKTSAVRDGDEYVINGGKVFITNGHNADMFIVACKTDPAARAKGISMILVEADRAGFRRGRLLEKIGLKAQDTAEIFFDDVRVPVSNLVGVENQGFFHMMKSLPQERLVQAIRAVTASEAALDMTIDYTVQRKAFGKSVSEFQAIQFRFATLYSEIAGQRALVDRCLEAHLAGELDDFDAAVVKLSSTEVQAKVVDECVTCFGGWGYMWEYPIARAYADARAARLAGGTTDIMKLIIGRRLVASRSQ
ncbi:acyl-CoA dehydrogenase family protein [Novosphingobium sp. PASSN1]|uniref:acyl-CoA dehydrogenase family protein n=1 Tax=Novosphingobium sp. PASSN1 TaxID=2015561 RepID=UPI000BDD4E5F|nr:acyl-CoA dehydrogenase family protein [Novosphingobium sp. PASSN1]OYU34801.1 MAG: acyl-CoA dehydrogenase [Novosphingobium sp. PASSN1]